MARITTWRIRTEDAEHTVTYSLNRVTGRMSVTLDGEAFELSAGPLAVHAARREPFRIVGPDGEPEQAILSVDRRGEATLLFRAQVVSAEVQTTGVVVEIGIGRKK